MWQRECVNLATPTPNPSPQGGGERTEYAALFCIKSNGTCPRKLFPLVLNQFAVIAGAPKAAPSLRPVPRMTAERLAKAPQSDCPRRNGRRRGICRTRAPYFLFDPGRDLNHLGQLLLGQGLP